MSIFHLSTFPRWRSHIVINQEPETPTYPQLRGQVCCIFSGHVQGRWWRH